MIDAQNFCHIETVSDGICVLFFVEYDGDDAVLHQVTTLEVGTFDLTITLPSEKMEAIWPRAIRFPDAALKVIAATKEMGLEVRRGAPSPVVDVAPSPADQIIGQIEELFPNWRSYRDLVDCITCELHELRKRAEGRL